MPIQNLHPVYKYALLYMFNGGDPLDIVAKYGLILSELRELYSKYHPILVDEKNRMKVIEELLRYGFTDEEISEAITWRDFEYYVETYFYKNGFKTVRNYRIGKTRREIDILAYREKILFCIECKQWDKKLSESSLKRIIKKHVKKCMMLVNTSTFKSYKIFPLVVTLRYSKIMTLDNVLILPIRGLKEFLKEYYSLILRGVLKDVNELKPH